MHVVHKAIAIIIVVAILAIIYFICRANKRTNTGASQRESERESEIRRERDTVKLYGGESKQLNRDNEDLAKQLRDDIKEQRNQGSIIRENNNSARRSNQRIREILNTAKNP